MVTRIKANNKGNFNFPDIPTGEPLEPEAERAVQPEAGAVADEPLGADGEFSDGEEAADSEPAGGEEDRFDLVFHFFFSLLASNRDFLHNQ